MKTTAKVLHWSLDRFFFLVGSNVPMSPRMAVHFARFCINLRDRIRSIEKGGQRAI